MTGLTQVAWEQPSMFPQYSTQMPEFCSIKSQDSERLCRSASQATVVLSASQLQSMADIAESTSASLRISLLGSRVVWMTFEPLSK